MRHPVSRLLVLVGMAIVLASPAFGQGAIPNVPDTPYRIQPSDVLAVQYRYTPEYDHETAVLPDGFITLPIVGEVKVAGLTVPDAVDAIRQQASIRLRDPEVTIEVREFQHPRFFVGGEVGSPGEFDLRGTIGVLEAIAMAGGFKSSAKHSQVVLVRRIDEGHVWRRVVDAKELARNVEAEDVHLQPGDLLFVPQNRLSKVVSIVPLAAPLTAAAVLFRLFVD